VASLTAKLAAAAVSGVVLAAVTGPPAHGHRHGDIASLLSSISHVIPAGGSYTPASWARAVLRAEGAPRTGCNMGAMLAWEGAEGGHWENDASFNPLNTTYDGPGGSWLYNGRITATINGDQVRAYNSWHTGLVATVRTLNLPAYAGIRAALAAGDSAQAVADAEAGTPWGTGPFTASCL